MKRALNLFALTVCVLSFALLCAAQPKKISEAEYNAVQKRHNPTGTNYRTIISYSKYQKSDGAMIWFQDEIREFTATGDMHSLGKIGKDAKSAVKFDNYQIGETAYQLQTDGTWRVYSVKKSGTTADETDSKSEPQETITTEYFYKGRVRLQDKNADLYEIVQIIKTKFKDTEQITKTTYRYWYDSDGRPLLSEWNTDSDKQTSQTVIKFEHGVKDLKFTPPVK